MVQTYTFITPEIEQAVLDYLGQGYTITGAAAKAGSAYSSIWEHRRRNPDFDQAVKDAIDRGTDTLEDWMLDKARDPRGFLANMACLRARRPDKWSDKAQERTLQAGQAPNISITINVPPATELPPQLQHIVQGTVVEVREPVEQAQLDAPYDADDST